MTENHPIVPSPEQVDQWFNDAVQLNSTPKYYIATQAAQWGADQELEACCAWIPEYCPWDVDQLRAARRSNPPSLKKQALLVLHDLPNIDCAHYNTILRALEQLDD